MKNMLCFSLKKDNLLINNVKYFKFLLKSREYNHQPLKICTNIYPVGLHHVWCFGRYFLSKTHTLICTFVPKIYKIYIIVHILIHVFSVMLDKNVEIDIHCTDRLDKFVSIVSSCDLLCCYEEWPELLVSINITWVTKVSL